MKKRLIIFYFFVTAYLCHASNTNKVWLTGAHSSSYTLDTNIDYAALPKEIAEEDMFGMVLGAETNSLKSGMWELNPARYFIIEKPGLYKLTVIQRLYVADTNSYLKTITLPPVTVDVRVEK